MQIKELTIEQFRLLVCEVVIEVLEEYIDLDEGDEVKNSSCGTFITTTTFINCYSC